MASHDSPEPTGADWGGPQQMSAWDSVMWRAEGDRRTTSTGMLVELLDSVPEAEAFLATHRDAVARIPRLRERVVEPPLPITPPSWSPDPHFDLGHHVRRVDLGGSADRADLLAHCEADWEVPLDRQRPPWVATLVHGFADGSAAYVFKCHHSLTDGMGLVQLLELTHTPTPEPREAVVQDGVSRASVTPTQLMVRAVGRSAVRAPGALRQATVHAGRVLTGPQRHATRAVRYGRSLGRLLGEVPRRSPLLAGSGPGNRLLMVEVELDDLRAAGRAVGGSVNDAYVAAVLGGLRRYHDKLGVQVDRIPVAMPISLRSADDPAGGNRFAGVRFAAPLAEPDPAVRMRMIGAFVREVRNEPALTYLDAASTALSLLPTPAIIELTARATAAADLQISNIPGLRRPAHLAGARVTGTYPMGPRPGVAAMVTMMTLEGRCCIGLNVDAHAFPEPELLQACLEDGFREVLAVTTSEEDAR